MRPLRSVYAQPAQNATLALAKRVQQPCARAHARARRHVRPAVASKLMHALIALWLCTQTLAWAPTARRRAPLTPRAAATARAPPKRLLTSDLGKDGAAEEGGVVVAREENKRLQICSSSARSSVRLLSFARRLSGRRSARASARSRRKRLRPTRPWRTTSASGWTSATQKDPRRNQNESRRLGSKRRVAKKTGRGDAVGETWMVGGRVAAPPRLPRGYSAEARDNAGDRQSETGLDGSRRWNADAAVVAPRNIHVAAAAVPRPVLGPSRSRDGAPAGRRALQKKGPDLEGPGLGRVA